MPAHAGGRSNGDYMWVVYILRSTKRRWFYVGSTSSIERRVIEHNSGKTKSTKSYAPLELVYQKSFETEREARNYERMLKDKRKAKEEILRKIEK